MALTHYQIGAIVSGCSGGVLIVIVLILVFVHPVRRFTFSRRKKPSPLLISATRDEENQHPCASSDSLSNISPFETIGNLTIPPGHRPLPSALDVINWVGMAIGLPAGAKPAAFESAPRISLHLPPLTPMTPTTKVRIAMAEAEARAESLHTERDAIRDTAVSHQVPLEHDEIVVRERKASDKAHVSSRRAGFVTATEKHDFDLGLQTSSDELSDTNQDVFVIGHDNDDRPEDSQLADHTMVNKFGSGKAMAALYHAV